MQIAINVKELFFFFFSLVIDFSNVVSFRFKSPLISIKCITLYRIDFPFLYMVQRDDIFNAYRLVLMETNINGNGRKACRISINASTKC